MARTRNRGHRGQGSEMRNLRWEQDGVRGWRRGPPVVRSVVRDIPWLGAIRQRHADPRDWQASNWVTGRATLLVSHEVPARAA